MNANQIYYLKRAVRKNIFHSNFIPTLYIRIKCSQLEKSTNNEKYQFIGTLVPNVVVLQKYFIYLILKLALSHGIYFILYATVAILRRKQCVSVKTMIICDI